MKTTAFLASCMALLLSMQLPAQEPGKDGAKELTGTAKVIPGRVVQVEGKEATLILKDKGRVTLKLLESALEVKDGDQKRPLKSVPPNKEIYFEIVESPEYGTVVKSARYNAFDVSPIVSPPPPGSIDPKGKGKKGAP